MIFALSGLGFLGLGAQPATPEWGAMLHEGRLYLTQAPQLMFLPGVVILLTVMGFNLIGEGSIQHRQEASPFQRERML